ncbi:hypothetical protein EVAR_59592_1 [Eumeta japonica]|uniref:Uncharacterized protein n=1 Tax=Eumeta variegata TaxID=151549 RepID=A0A4C1Z8E2_EUMVA|nr:hypothetical protein EVAR_59592_1 [Eumeta japonica]
MPEWKGRVPLTRSHCELITRRDGAVATPGRSSSARNFGVAAPATARARGLGRTSHTANRVPPSAVNTWTFEKPISLRVRYERGPEPLPPPSPRRRRRARRLRPAARPRLRRRRRYDPARSLVSN